MRSPFAHRRDRSAGRGFGSHVADAQPARAAREPAVGDERGPDARADNGRGRRQHLLHARTAARAFVADHHHVAVVRLRPPGCRPAPLPAIRRRAPALRTPSCRRRRRPPSPPRRWAPGCRTARPARRSSKRRFSTRPDHVAVGLRRGVDTESTSVPVTVFASRSSGALAVRGDFLQDRRNAAGAVDVLDVHLRPAGRHLADVGRGGWRSR